MKVMTTWSVRPGCRDEAIQRFLAGGGARAGWSDDAGSLAQHRSEYGVHAVRVQQSRGAVRRGRPVVRSAGAAKLHGGRGCRGGSCAGEVGGEVGQSIRWSYGKGIWWAQQDSNLRLPPCEGGTLPLSYAPRSAGRCGPGGPADKIKVNTTKRRDCRGAASVSR